MPSTPVFSSDGQIASISVAQTEQSRINLADPSQLEFEYMQQMDAVVEAALGAETPLRAAHIGACGCALAWSWHLKHPNSRQVAFEIDAYLAEAVRQWLPLPRKPHLRIRVADGREALHTSQAHFDVIVRDAFSASAIPSQLQTQEFVEIVAAHLTPRGIYLANCAHGGSANGRPDVAALTKVFSNVAVIAASKTLKGARWGNLVAVGWNDALDLDLDQIDRSLRRLPLPASLLSGAQLQRWLAGAAPARD